MPFENATPYPALDTPFLDERGRNVVIAIVKGTFTVDELGRVTPADDAAEVRVADEPYDPEKLNSSIRYFNDVCTRKAGTDVVVLGEAVAKTPSTVVDVGVRVRERLVQLRVHGERLFYRSGIGVAVGPATKFERKPIVYEAAYGGATEDWKVVEARNPSGVGVAARPADLVDKPAPRIEHPAYPHKSASDRHPPVGFNAIPAHWSPRREMFGTVDELWLKTRVPIMPGDFDPRANNVAHSSLQFEPLAAGDPIATIGMTEGHAFSFELPKFPVVFRGVFDNGPNEVVRPYIDTVLVEPSRRRFELVCRACFAMGRGLRVLREIRADVDD
jgi:hypothetical protein